MIDSKLTLRTKDVGSSLIKLQVQERTHDSVMFKLATHRKLRGCDVARLKVENVARVE